MFPTPEKAALPLRRCMRFLPHHNDTGGFFVAVLEKVGEVGPLLDPEMSFRLRTINARGGGGGGDGVEEAIDELKAAAVAATEYAIEVRGGGWGGVVGGGVRGDGGKVVGWG